MLSKTLRLLLPVIILSGCVGGALWLYYNQPETKVQEMPPTLVSVEGMTLKPTTFPVQVRSQGAVQPRTRSTLLPEVAAKVIEVSASFRPGGFFEKDEVLMKLDPVDYETAVVIAQATQAQAESMLAEEQAKAEQALENWASLGREGKPSALVLRTPQLAKARADVASAQAQVLKSKRDLERTVVRAPYAGQVLEQGVDVGQLVSQGTVLGRIFAVDYVEIRLPLPERETRFLQLPEHYRGAVGTAPPEASPKVVLKARVNGKQARWEGRIVRVESAIDSETRQVMAVGQVNDPFGKHADGSPPLKIGQFVEAEIAGEDLQNIFIIPRSAVRAGNEIILISSDSPRTLRRMNVEPLTADEKTVILAADLPKGPKSKDILCLTPIPFPADGAKVNATVDGIPDPAAMAGPKVDAAKSQASAKK